MAIGTLDRNPPPFFRQGPSALTKLVFFSALAVFLMAADSRFTLTQPLRAGMATALLPVEQVLNVPVQLAQTAEDYLAGEQQALAREKAADLRLTAQSERAARADQLAVENRQLRALLDLRPALQVRSTAAEVLYEAPDPFSRKLYIDRGAAHGIVAGSPVMNDRGVLGQVTRVYPLSSEVTLLVDEDAAIPVVNARTQQRGAAFGGSGGAGTMELRFMASNADVQVGDSLVTSGLDGVYPAGLPVAKVVKFDRRSDTAFARIVLAPTALPDDVRHVLVLEPLERQMVARPEPKPAPKAESRLEPDARPGKPNKGPRR
jgi:rod shape-determining protein MreC